MPKARIKGTEAPKARIKGTEAPKARIERDRRVEGAEGTESLKARIKLRGRRESKGQLRVG